MYLPFGYCFTLMVTVVVLYSGFLLKEFQDVVFGNNCDEFLNIVTVDYYDNTVIIYKIYVTYKWTMILDFLILKGLKEEVLVLGIYLAFYKVSYQGNDKIFMV